MNNHVTGNGITMEMGAILATIEEAAKEIRRAGVLIGNLLNERDFLVSQEEERYLELYEWWAKKFRRPLCKNHINARSIKSISTYGSTYGKEVYRTALKAAIFAGYAVEVPRPKGERFNAKYYVLFLKPKPLQYLGGV